MGEGSARAGQWQQCSEKASKPVAAKQVGDRQWKGSGSKASGRRGVERQWETGSGKAVGDKEWKGREWKGRQWETGSGKALTNRLTTNIGPISGVRNATSKGVTMAVYNSTAANTQ